MRVVIVDDEAPARQLIATLSRREADVDVVAECGSGSSALAALEQHSPDLVFLDIQMPGLNGFDLLGRIPSERWPLVVFVTAYHEHAVRAFEMHALDYLLKPFEFDRVRQAIARARGQLEQRTSVTQQARLISLLEEMQTRSRSWDRIVVREPGRVMFLKPDEIDWIEAEGNYVRLHLGNHSHLLRETLSEAETRLAERKFLRINRSTLLNLERVREWQPLFHGDSVVILKDGSRLNVSRVYRDKFDGLVARLSWSAKPGGGVS